SGAGRSITVKPSGPPRRSRTAAFTALRLFWGTSSSRTCCPTHSSGGCVPYIDPMDFDLTPDETAFRHEVRSWLRANRPARAGSADEEDASSAEGLGGRRGWAP